MRFRFLNTILFTLLAGQVLAVGNEKTFYVSPGGSDRNSGTLEKPFATAQKALSKVLESSKAIHGQSYTVYFREGIYYQNSTLSLEFNQPEGEASLSLRAYNNERVVFHGGKKLDGRNFKKTINKSTLQRIPKEAQGKVWEIDLKKYGIKDFGALKKHGFGTPIDVTPLELFMDGEPQVLARYPNRGEGVLPIGKIYDVGSIPRRGDFSNRGGEFGFEYDRPQRWRQAEDIWIHGKFSHGYNDDHMKIGNIDYEKKSFKVTSPHLYGLRTSTEKYIDRNNSSDLSGLSVRGYYAYNLLEEIDQPGEYYLNRKTGRLYVYALSSMEDANIEVSLIEEPFIEIINSSNVNIEGIEFTCARGMGIYLENASGISINSCEFSNLGTVAISTGQKLRNNKPAYNADGSPAQTFFVSQDFSNIQISNCKIYNTGTGGIILTGGNRRSLAPSRNLVFNTEFFANERINQTYSPSIRMYGVGQTIKNCYFHDLDHQAIQFLGNDHLIEYCRFDKVCTDADDMGPIYTGRDPSSRGTKIQYNYFSNILPQHKDTKMCGVYVDDGSGGIIVKNNFFYKVGNPGRKQGFGAVFFHGGHDNVVDGNIFMDCTAAVGHAPWNDKRWAESLKKPLQIQRLQEDVDIMSAVYQEKYPELKNYFSDYENRINQVKNNLFIRSQSVQKGNYYLNQNLTLDSTGESPMSIDYSEAKEFLKELEPFPFEKVGIQK